ncbi:MAG: hypothetical protein SFT93_03315, partial [Rickettsiaceae bacterium]|nr:hypothetical protein [Rickettsiaceae bacterium]
MINFVNCMIFNNLKYNLEEARAQMRSLGLVLAFSFPGFYFFNKYFANSCGYENFYLRMVICFFGTLLIARKYWPKILIQKEIYIFHLIVFFSFPFFFSYMLFMNPDSNIWQINGLVGFVLLSIFVDWIIFIVMSIAAILLAYFFAYSSYQDYSHLYAVFGSYSAPLIYLLLSYHKRKAIDHERNLYQTQLNDALIQKTKALLLKDEFIRNLSHEVRTPLTGIVSVGSYLASNWDS